MSAFSAALVEVLLLAIGVVCWLSVLWLDWNRREHAYIAKVPQDDTIAVPIALVGIILLTGTAMACFAFAWKAL